MKNNWAVTYEIVTKESTTRGFKYEATSFRNALNCFGKYAESANSYPINGSIRWLTTPIIQDSYYFRFGEERTLSLHIPEQITPASRLRLARYLGL